MNENCNVDEANRPHTNTQNEQNTQKRVADRGQIFTTRKSSMKIGWRMLPNDKRITVG